MGEVWRARDERLQRMVAVKILPPDVANDPGRRARFEQEARALGALNHPNVVAVYDVGQEDGRAYLVSELVDGESLRAILDRGPMATRKTIDIAVQIAEGMAAAHALGIIHRDLKPENVMVTRTGLVKLLDFGLAKQNFTGSGENTATMALSQPGTVMGTAGYMSPEQVRAQPVDARSDIFSFGCVLYEMITGKRAFQAASGVETMHAVLNAEPPEFEGEQAKMPPALATIVRRCLEKQPEQRFQSAADLAFALRSATSGISVSGVQAPVAAQKPASRSWLWAVTGTAAAVLLFAAGFLLRDRTSQTGQPQFQRITFRKGFLQNARFTPDGQNVVYQASFEGGPSHIYLAVPGNPESRDLGIEAGMGAVSAKQELLLFTGPSGEYSSSRLSIGSISGGLSRPLLDGVLAADWAPDGQSLAVLRRVNHENRLEYPLGHVIADKVAWPLWMIRVSPDGNAVVIPTRYNGTAIALNVVYKDGKSHFLGQVSGQNATGESSSLCWSPKGDEVWFRSFETAEQGIVYAVNMKRQRRIAFSLPSRVKLYDISRNGDALIGAGSSQEGILGVGPGSTTERDLSCLDSAQVAGVSDDGQIMVANIVGEGGTTKGSIYLRKTDGSPAVRIGDGHAYHLSADGKWIAGYQIQPDGVRKFVILPTGPGEAIDVDVPGIKYAAAYGFIGDDQYLITGLSAGKKWQSFLWDKAHGSVRPISPEGIPDTLAYYLSPDRKQVLMLSPTRTWTVYRVDGGPAQEVRGLEPLEAPLGWRSDNRSIYVRPSRESADTIPVSILEIATGKRAPWKVIHPAQPVVEIHDLAINPEGNAYAYSYVLIQSDLYVARGLH